VKLITFSLFILCLTAQELVTIISPHPDTYKKEFERAFYDWSKGRNLTVQLRWLDIGGTIDILRYLIENPYAEVDILFGGGTDPFEELKKRNMLLKLQLRDEIKRELIFNLNGVLINDPDFYWISVNLNSFGLCVNKLIFQVLGLPQTSTLGWDVLTRPALKNKIALADPRKSGSARFTYDLIFQKYGWKGGWSFMYAASRNAKSFTFSSTVLINKLILKDILAAPLVESYARKAVSLNQDLTFFISPDIPSLFGDAIGILSRTKNRAAAQSVVEFAMTDWQVISISKVGQFPGPKKHEIKRLAAIPSAYKKVNNPVVENPFVNPTQENSIIFDPQKSLERWYELSFLIGSIVFDLNFLIKNIENTETIPPPLSEEAFNEIVNTKRWRNVFLRDQDLATLRAEFMRQVKGS